MANHIRITPNKTFRGRLHIQAGLLFISLGLLLGGCNQPAAQALLEDYLDSMSRVLETPIDTDLGTALLDLPALPEKRERRLPVTDIREGIIEVWDFQQCGMMHLIAERNSSLGKVMPASQKMAYELRFMAALQVCRDQLQALAQPSTEQQAFLQRLLEIHALKQANLPADIWNGIYASDEITQHFALGQPPLPPDYAGHGHVQRALERLQVLAGLATADPLQPPDWLPELEDSYYALYSSDFGAQWLTGLRLLTQTLERAAIALEQRLQRQAFCFPGHRPRRAEILGNIFRKYYAGQVQPYMALIQREGREWLAVHEQIMAQLPVPAAMQAYREQVISQDTPDSLWQSWQQANQRHTRAWQQILRQCGMMPGQDQEDQETAPTPTPP
ncbi:MAG: DUF3080 family protein [Thiolinea sp.]